MEKTETAYRARDHGMAMNIINDNHAAPGGRVPDEPIWELAERITGDLLECIAHLEKAYKAIEPLTYLTPDPDYESDAEELA